MCEVFWTPVRNHPHLAESTPMNPQPHPENPFKGLRPFEPKDKEKLFGRDRDLFTVPEDFDAPLPDDLNRDVSALRLRRPGP